VLLARLWEQDSPGAVQHATAHCGDDRKSEPGKRTGEHAAAGTLARKQSNESGNRHAQPDEYGPPPHALRPAIGEEHREAGDHEDGEARILYSDVRVPAGRSEDDAEQPVEPVGLAGRRQPNILNRGAHKA